MSNLPIVPLVAASQHPILEWWGGKLSFAAVALLFLALVVEFWHRWRIRKEVETDPHLRLLSRWTLGILIVDCVVALSSWWVNDILAAAQDTRISQLEQDLHGAITYEQADAIIKKILIDGDTPRHTLPQVGIVSDFSTAKSRSVWAHLENIMMGAGWNVEIPMPHQMGPQNPPLPPGVRIVGPSDFGPASVLASELKAVGVPVTIELTEDASVHGGRVKITVGAIE